MCAIVAASMFDQLRSQQTLSSLIFTTALPLPSLSPGPGFSAAPLSVAASTVHLASLLPVLGAVEALSFDDPPDVDPPDVDPPDVDPPDVDPPDVPELSP